MFCCEYEVKMFDTDASGFLFFTSQLRMAHEAYESFMASAHLTIAHILRSSDYLLAIVHAETDYSAPSSIGDRVRIEMEAQRIGKTSFTLGYRLYNDEGQQVGTVQTVHVAINKHTREKVPLPDPVRQAIMSLQQ